MTNNYHHISVLLREAIVALEVLEGAKYIDATLGGGGHTKEIIKRGGIVLGIDQDEEAINHITENQTANIKGQKLILIKGNFSEIEKIANENNFSSVDGVLFDLGVSSNQLVSKGRGFSFQTDERLDMRMNKNQKFSAYDVINSYPKEDLVKIFQKYGEEHNSRQIADLIADTRKSKKIETTGELARLVMKVKKREEKIHPATRIFQAIRIEVNDEIEALRKGLEGAVNITKPGGRIVVISFHSLEDRVVKQMFDQLQRKGKGNVLSKKPVVAGEAEVKVNKRSRSAKLRIFEKI